MMTLALHVLLLVGSSRSPAAYAQTHTRTHREVMGEVVGVGDYMEMKNNWCPSAVEKCAQNTASPPTTDTTDAGVGVSISTSSPCDNKILLFLMSKKSEMFVSLSEALKRDSRSVILTSSASINVLEACVNISTSISTFNDFTGDPFTHNPFDLKDLLYNVQQICLKNLKNVVKDSNLSLNRFSDAHIIAFPYLFPSFGHIKQLHEIFPCARAVVSKRHQRTSKFRSLKKLMPVLIVPPKGSDEDLAIARHWLGLRHL
jgi:hypothetical protein